MKRAMILTVILAGISALAISPRVWGQAGHPAGTTTWEYRTIGWPDDAELNRLGAAGWELTSVVVINDKATSTGGGNGMEYHNNTRYIFKRPK